MDMQFCASSSFGPVFNFAHGQPPAMHYPEEQYPVYAGFPGLQYIYAPQHPSNEFPPDRNGPGDGKTESKPRLSKEEVERLEKIFQENPKPSSSVKAQLADELGLERPRINVGSPLPLFASDLSADMSRRTGFRTEEQRPSRRGNRRSTRLAGPLRRPDHSNHTRRPMDRRVARRLSTRTR